MAKANIKYDWQIINLVRKSLLPFRYCPVCKSEMPMAKFEVLILDSIRNTASGKRVDYSDRFRCMGCLSLWDKFEGKVDEQNDKITL